MGHIHIWGKVHIYTGSYCNEDMGLYYSLMILHLHPAIGQVHRILYMYAHQIEKLHMMYIHPLIRYLVQIPLCQFRTDVL